MSTDNVEQAVTGRKVSRRWLLRNTAGLTAGVVAAGAMGEASAGPATTAEASAAPDHDPATGEIFDRARHHHWDTV